MTVSPPLCSVLIPTFNRRATLIECLNHLRAQSVGPHRLEVIVVDDGSTDSTAEALASYNHTFGSFVVHRQPNAGPAVARNLGLWSATADIVLFINDDTLLAPEAIEVHLCTHAEHERSMVLGTFDFVPGFGDTVLGTMLSSTPHLFAYPLLRDGDVLGPALAATCNLSVSADAARATGFDERFGFAAEDVDFAIRLEQDGYALRYAAQARAQHDHYLTVEGLQRMAVLRGVGASTLCKKTGQTKDLVAEAQRAMVAERTLRQSFATWGDTLNGYVHNDQPADNVAYAALAGIFKVGQLLGYLEDPELVSMASASQLEAAASSLGS